MEFLMKIRLFFLAAVMLLVFACDRNSASDSASGSGGSGISADAIETAYSGALTGFKEQNAGKVLVVNFFASWCPPCRAETPDFVKVYGEQKDKFSIVGLSTDSSKEDIVKYIDEFGVTYPVYLADRTLSAEFGINTIPTSIIYGPDGRLIDIIVGAIPEKDLLNLIEKLSVK
jgi:thiol-disulfide isomerase/thioredoxin